MASCGGTGSFRGWSAVANFIIHYAHKFKPFTSLGYRERCRAQTLFEKEVVPIRLANIENLVEMNELLPEAVARERCVLVIALEQDSLTLACPDAEFGATERETVEFIMSREINWRSFPAGEIEHAIQYAYGSANRIVGCTWKFNFECPKKWGDLKLTNDNLIRQCETCSRSVYLCTNNDDVVRHAEVGNCVCVLAECGESLGDVVLQEFDGHPVDFSDDIEPENTR